MYAFLFTSKDKKLSSTIGAGIKLSRNQLTVRQEILSLLHINNITNMTIKTILLEFKVNSPEKDSFIQGILDGLKKRDFVFHLLSSMLNEDCHFNRSIYENSNSVLNVSWIKDSDISMTSRYVSGNYCNTGCGVFEWGVLD